MTAALEAEAVGVSAGRKAILARVSLSVSRGESVALVGPNGAGKSTLLRCLSGELAPSAGTVRLKGRDIAAFSSRTLAAHRAVLSQSISLAFPFTVAEVVAMGAGDARGRRVTDSVAAALEQVDLAGFGERIFTTLSGGEQQRAHFARILVQVAGGEALHGPGVLLLDEPTASLDLRHQLVVASCVRRCAANGTAVLSILHDLNLATLFADRLVVLDRGAVASDGAPQSVVTDKLLADVFGIADAVGRIPPGGIPFVLPHGARAMSASLPASSS